MSMLVTRRSVSPNLSCESHTGISGPMLAHMCMIGLSF